MKPKLILSFVLLAVAALTAKNGPRTTIQVVASSTSTIAPNWTKTTTSGGDPRQLPLVNIKAILSDGRRIILSCQQTFVWTRCKPLDAGSYSAEVRGKSVLVYTQDLSGKEQQPITYSYIGSWEPDSPPPSPPRAVVTQPVQNRTETPTSVNSPPPAVTRERQSNFTWSSKDCTTCMSSRVANFYADGSGLFVEAIDGLDGNVATATAGLSGVGDNLVVAVGFVNGGKGDLIVDPKQAVSLESDSSSHMVLFAVEHPDSRIEGMEVIKKQFKEGPVHLSAGDSAAGYLFFPGDFEASHITVVMHLGNETFRFPFVKNSKDSARFDGTQ